MILMNYTNTNMSSMVNGFNSVTNIYPQIKDLTIIYIPDNDLYLSMNIC